MTVHLPAAGAHLNVDGTHGVWEMTCVDLDALSFLRELSLWVVITFVPSTHFPRSPLLGILPRSSVLLWVFPANTAVLRAVFPELSTLFEEPLSCQVLVDSFSK